MIIFLTVAVVVLALYFVLSVRTADLPALTAVPAAAVVEEKKAVIAHNLRDLEFEFNLGKLTREDFERARAELENELAALGVTAAEAARQTEAAAVPALTVCLRCGASFAQAMKFCGECGAPMKGGNA